MSESFTTEPLRVLTKISAQHQPITRTDLAKLKQQIEATLILPDVMFPLSDDEMIQSSAKYGAGAVCIGDFVIKRRD